jgi:hypothetical protein
MTARINRSLAITYDAVRNVYHRVSSARIARHYQYLLCVDGNKHLEYGLKDIRSTSTIPTFSKGHYVNVRTASQVLCERI